MAVDLFDLVDSLKREVNPPGASNVAFPDATDDEYAGYLSDAFWEARLDGILGGYTEANNTVTPTSGTDDLPREFQQLIVIYAGFRILKNALRQLKTQFRAQAGPVVFETQQSATTLKAIMDDLRARRDWLLFQLSETGAVTTVYIDAIAARQERLYFNNDVYSSGWVGY